MSQSLNSRPPTNETNRVLASERERLISNGSKKGSNYSIKNVSDSSKIEKDDKMGTLVIAFVAILFFHLGNRIFGKLETYPMYNYPMFLNMMSSLLYIPICFAYILPVQHFTKLITKAQTDIPKYKFAVMGGLDSLAGIMQVFAVNYISNAPMIVLVSQSAIPISMMVSKVFLKAKYTAAQYSGAAVVLLGIVVVLIPNLTSSNSTTTTTTTNSDSLTQIFWVTVLVLSCIPMCMSSVYKEKALGEIDIDVVYLNGWVCIFQFIIAIPLCFPSAAIINLPYDQIIPNIYGGMLCWAGINSIEEFDGVHQPDNCEMGPIFVSLFFFFNVIYNLLIIVILKHGSANILWMSSTVIVPLSNLAFSLNFMPGHRPLTSWDLIGLGVIMFGLVLYRFTSQIKSLIHHLCDKITSEELAAEKEARHISSQAEKKQTRYVGLNQIESLQTFIDTRVQQEQKISLFRSPQQIRGSLLLRLGIPPSPHITVGPQGKYGSIKLSPAPPARSRHAQPLPVSTPPLTVKKRLSETELA